MVPYHDLVKSFGTPTTKPKMAQKVFASVLQLCNSFVPLKLNKKKWKEFNSFLKMCLKMIFNNTETILN